MTSKINVRVAVLVGLVFCTAARAQTAATPQSDEAARRAEAARAAMQQWEEAKKNAAWRIGDPAQPLEVRWIKDKVPVDFNDGKVRVVEFWATWCGPCRRNMPHMSEIAHKYRGKVEVISVNVWENKSRDPDAPYEDDVISFVRNAGRMMDHPVAMDTKDGFMGKNWMNAAGEMGIPMAFIIDKHGRYAWSAPAFEGLEEAIDLALEDRLDASAIARVKENYTKAFQMQREFRSRSQAALDAGNADEAIQLANKAAAALPVFANTSWQLLYRAYKMKGPAQVDAFIERVAEQSHAPVDLSSLARSIGRDDPASSIRLLEAAARYSRPYDPVALSLAQALARSGDYAKAVAVQEKVVAGLKSTTSPQ